jgi:hypothetical protein
MGWHWQILWRGTWSSALVADLSQILGEVVGLIIDGVFHGAPGVLTWVASHYLTLDFRVVGRCYAAGWSVNQLCELGQSLEPVVIAIAKATTAEWVKVACRVERETALASSSVQAIEAGLRAAPPALAPSQGAPPVDLAARPLPSTLSANADGVPQ